MVPDGVQCGGGGGELVSFSGAYGAEDKHPEARVLVTVEPHAHRNPNRELHAGQAPQP